MAGFTLAGLVPDLQHILFWMSNSVELLYFIQQKCPLYMQAWEEELDITGTVCHCPQAGGGLSAATLPLATGAELALRWGPSARW